MASSISVMASAGRNRGVGFAKLQGEDFEYFMQINNLAIRPADNNKDQQEVLLKEEEYVLASIGIVISDLCGLKKMIPIEKLHSELVACYSATWPQRQVQMHLAPEAGSSAAGTECKPWLKLMYLLRKYPERFTVMNSSCDEEGRQHRCMLR
uniref:Uncharacterized protein n=1 Tax=Oryza glumipatula TaxID=40148 RepID=A0A0E0B501_9ORYZ